MRRRRIEADDLPAVARLLARRFPAKSLAAWRADLDRLAARPPVEDHPRFGWLLESGGEVVGVVLQIFARRPDGEITCCLSSWCVEPAFSASAGVLLWGGPVRRDVTYLNVSPDPPTWPILEARGFRRYVDGLTLAAPAAAAAARLLARLVGRGAAGRAGPKGPRLERFDPERPPADLPRADQERLTQLGALGAWTFLVRPRAGAGSGAQAPPAPLALLPRRLKGLPLAAQVAWAPVPEVLAGAAGPLARALAARGRLLLVLDGDQRRLGLAGVFVKDRGVKYFFGPRTPAMNDLTDTEAVLFGL